MAINPTLSVVVAVRDEEEVLFDCLKRLKFANEIIVVIDDRTKDATEAVAKEFTDKIYWHTFKNFSDFKNYGIKKASFDWIMIVDADERISKPLSAEILTAIRSDEYSGYEVNFVNYFLGSKMQWGGWTDEWPLRLFRRGVMVYEGDIHEIPSLTSPTARIGHLRHGLAHFSHRSITQNQRKSIVYLEVQSKELLNKKVPTVTWKSIIRLPLREFYIRVIRNRGYRDGMPGLIDGMYQAFYVFMLYARLWELQLEIPINEQYKIIERNLDVD